MLPLINGDCRLEVRYEDNMRYGLGDLVVYTDDGLLVCHRVICRLPGDRLLLKGDNTRQTDGVYASADIVGRVETIYDKELEIHLNQGKHRWLKYVFVAYSVLSIFFPFVSYNALARSSFLNRLYHGLIQ